MEPEPQNPQAAQLAKIRNFSVSFIKALFTVMLQALDDVSTGILIFFMAALSNLKFYKKLNLFIKGGAPPSSMIKVKRIFSKSHSFFLLPGSGGTAPSLPRASPLPAHSDT
ncbi:MAG: hypothetical protein LBG07_11825, partial [Treponema sp.]|nr:hypothetical protein [Treponema sp.]